MEQKLHDAASALPETELSFDAVLEAPAEQKTSIFKRPWCRAVVLTVCIALVLSIGVYAVEAREYHNAVTFFDQYGLSTDGLSRGEIKRVYRDITTNTFTYSKTAEVLEKRLSINGVGGYEIPQEDPTPEALETLWNELLYNGKYWVSDPENLGLRYTCRFEYKQSALTGLEVLDKSYVEKYDGQTLLWSTSLTEFWVTDCVAVSDGVIAYGQTDPSLNVRTYYAWMVKIDTDGNIQWKRRLENGSELEDIAAILEKNDGSYAVISRADLERLCFSLYSPAGELQHSQITEIGNYGIWDAARLGDGYIVQLGNYMTNEHAKIARLDSQGNLTQTHSYSSEDSWYYITDMIEFGGNVYLSAYAVPKLEDEGGRHEIAGIHDYLFDNNIWEISSEELTPMVRDNYTAVLLICNPEEGTPQEFYSVKGSLGGTLSLGEGDTLLWNVESIASTFYSPTTSSFTIGGTCQVFRYTFDRSGKLLSQEKTGQLAAYRR